MTHSFGLAGSTVEVRCSTVRDGDFHVEAPWPALAHRRSAFAPGGIWTQLDEVHGVQVRTVTTPGEHDLAAGDGLVTDVVGAVLAVWVGDCAPVVLVSDDGVLGAAHAGWRGALAGVLPATVAAMRAVPGPRSTGSQGAISAYLGPCIHPCCYEFGDTDLVRFEQRFGPTVVATTAWGTPALHLPEVIRRSLEECGVDVVDVGGCTGCRDDLWFSHRRRAQPQRQVMTISKRASH